MSQNNYRFTFSQLKVRACIFFGITILFSVPAYSEPLSSIPTAQTTIPTTSTVNIPPNLDADKTSTDRISLDYVKGIFTDTGKIIVSPSHWESIDWLKAGAVVGVTGGLFLVDGNIRNFAQKHQSSAADKFATVGNDIGNPLYTLPPVGAFYLYGYLADDIKARKTSLLAVESLAISSIFTETLKMTTHRSRPSTGASPDTWNGPQLSTKNLSFCSGHSSSAFSIATVFAEEYKNTWYAPPIAYGLASLTGLSRIYVNEHWASDVFFGAVVGYFVGQAVVKFHEDDIAKKISVVPLLSSDYKGMAVTYKF